MHVYPCVVDQDVEPVQVCLGNPILRDVPWQRMPKTISWLDDAKLTLKFQ